MSLSSFPTILLSTGGDVDAIEVNNIIKTIQNAENIPSEVTGTDT